MPVGQASGNGVRQVRQSHEIERFARAVGNFLFLVPLRRSPDQRGKHLTAGIRMQTHHDILKRGHFTKQPQILKSPPDARGRAQVRRQWREVAPVKIYFAAGLTNVTRNQIKKSRFPRAVWSDQAVHMTCFNRKIDAADGDQAAKATCKLLGDE